ncbi:hypothetical protein F5Y07DRAFT_184771 [Xylaria sp. FL0933]|nr:hypothetical protein F5Y07DRAFT_184771 [Xylaria sp. FL0933]
MRMRLPAGLALFGILGRKDPLSPSRGLSKPLAGNRSFGFSRDFIGFGVIDGPLVEFVHPVPRFPQNLGSTLTQEAESCSTSKSLRTIVSLRGGLLKVPRGVEVAVNHRRDSPHFYPQGSRASSRILEPRPSPPSCRWRGYHAGAFGTHARRRIDLTIAIALNRPISMTFMLASLTIPCSCMMETSDLRSS